mmetsp:Transcript_25210/g.70279  ORF Transcript_25210/g.70279 Transcript_25210/m.70279 type:complete len:387 (-) Transcript_25210:294-1454(-)
MTSTMPPFSSPLTDERNNWYASARQRESFDAKRTSSRYASCKHSRGTAKMPVGSKFWPARKDQPCSCAQLRTSSTSSVLPVPPEPLINSTPERCSCLFKTSLSALRDGQGPQPRSGSCKGFRCRTRPRRQPRNAYARVGVAFPFNFSSPASSKSSTRAALVFVSPSTRIPFAGALPISLAARFTMSPMTVYSRHSKEPTTPHQHKPVATPMRPSMFSSRSVSQNRIAQSTARVGSSMKCTKGGKPKATNISAPLSSTKNLFKDPSKAYTERCIRRMSNCVSCAPSSFVAASRGSFLCGSSPEMDTKTTDTRRISSGHVIFSASSTARRWATALGRKRLTSRRSRPSLDSDSHQLNGVGFLAPSRTPSNFAKPACPQSAGTSSNSKF